MQQPKKTNEWRRHIQTVGGGTQADPSHRPVPHIDKVIQLDPVKGIVPKPPRELDGVALERWTDVWESQARMWIAKTDMPALLRYCELYAIYVRQRDAYYETPIIPFDDRSGKTLRNTALADLLAVEKSVRDLEDRFALHPAGRTKQGVAEVKLTTGLEKVNEIRNKARGKVIDVDEVDGGDGEDVPDLDV